MKARALPLSPTAAIWLALAAVTAVLAQTGGNLAKAIDARWLMKVPRELRLPIKDDISTFMKWLLEDATFGLFSFTDLTRASPGCWSSPTSWPRRSWSAVSCRVSAMRRCSGCRR
jgi:hypothetical protein